MFNFPIHRRASPLMLWAVLCLAALPVQAEVKSLRQGAAALPGPSVAMPEPVSRLIIRYREGLAPVAAGQTAPGSERAQAQALVARSAERAGWLPLHFLKSVSPRVQVVALDQPVSPEQAQAVVRRLQADPAVLDVMVDQRVRPHAVPNDPSFINGDQWHLRTPAEVPGGINAVPAWSLSTGAGVVIAVLDGGDTGHADLLTNLLPGYDFVSSDPVGSPQAAAGLPFWTANDGNARDASALDPGDWITSADVSAGFCSRAEDSSWHGTHIAGLAAAVGNNNRDGLGVAYGAEILPVRVLGRCGGYVSDILAGARWAVGLGVPGVPTNTQPARILSLSLGYEDVCSPVVQNVVDEVRNTGASLIASSGNDASTVISAPASCAGVMAVTAHTREGDSASYANVGRNVQISAPGGGLNSWLPEQSGTPRGIVATSNNGLTVPTSDSMSSLIGTSMAVPQVSGVIALLASLQPMFAMSTLEAIIADSARSFPLGSYCVVNPRALAPGFCGAGLVDAAAAAQRVVAASLQSADLGVEQRAPAADLAPGQTVSFTVILRNAGPEASAGLTLTHALGEGLELLSAQAGGTPVALSASGWSVTLAGLAVNAKLEVQVQAIVRASAGRVSSEVFVVSPTKADAAVSNNSDRVELTVSGVPVSGGGGGGCTAAPGGQADASLLLLALLALGLAVLRQRRR